MPIKPHLKFSKKLKDKHGNKFTLLGKYTCSTAKIKVKCNDCGIVSERQAVRLLGRGTCMKCFNIRHTKTHEKFAEQILEKFGNDFDLLGKYTYDKNKIKVRHNLCGAEYEITASKLLQKGNCRHCQPDRLRKMFAKTKELFISQVDVFRNGEYTFLGEYVNALTRSLVRHEKCGYEYMVKPNNLFLGCRCPQCANESRRLKDTTSRTISRNIRSRIIHMLRYSRKSAPTLDLIGCTISELKDYLEGLFLEDMSWDNYGINGWHIDHIRPCASFDLRDVEQQKECFHHSNYQPLWAKDNLAKSSWWNGVLYRGETNVTI